MKLVALVYTLVFFGLTSSVSSLAGEKAGNGGDICENRFKTVSDDLNLWINKGGSKGLSLPAGVSVEQYDSEMLAQIERAQISCVSDKVMVGQAEKTCKNFVDSVGVPRIICNSARFLGTSESSQYVLVHHEYAGLAGFEVNDGEISNYDISNQITDYLVDQTVKKLAIIKKPAPPVPVGRTEPVLFDEHGYWTACGPVEIKATQENPRQWAPLAKDVVLIFYIQFSPKANFGFATILSNTSNQWEQWRALIEKAARGETYAGHR